MSTRFDFNYDKTPRVLEHDRPNVYSNKVLVGKWCESRCPQIEPEIIEKTTTYLDHYKPQPLQENHAKVIWDKKLEDEESTFVSQLGRYDYPNYFENFSSTYDLSYNHFPKCLKKELPRKYRLVLHKFEPLEEYLPSFGNITQFGLLEHKKYNWRCEVQDPRLTYSTSYRDDYLAPEKSNYEFRRWGIPMSNSSIMVPSNHQSVILKLRGQPTFTVPPNDGLVQIPREKRCNPITWECPNTDKPMTRCIENE